MVGNFCNRTACRIRNRRRRHDNNMTLRKKKPPRASQHYMGWRAGQKSLLLPVAGEFVLLTLPFIERANRRSEVLLHNFGNPTYRALAADDDKAAAAGAGGLAPLITSHSMRATSAKRAGWERANTLSWYCGNSSPVRLRIT